MIALLADPGAAGAVERVAAGCEEEGVPLETAIAEGERLELAREAARRSPLGIGVGLDAGGGCIALAAAPGRAYVEGAADRSLGRAAGRIAARRPF